jgi:Kef-type K+ transport systems, membrane components
MPHVVLASGEQTESILLVVLIQLCLIIIAARVFAILFRKIGQPAVVGEIAAGLILGPSVLGKLAPETFATVFDPSVSDVFKMLAQLGLIFLLFLIGLEFDFRHLRTSGRSSLLISVTGIVLPFALGWILAQFLHPHLEMAVDQRGFALFMGTAMSITAIPILGRIMMELDITRTRLGAITITAAAIDDAAGWILLAAVSAMVRADFQIVSSLRMLGETILFALLMIFVAKPLLQIWVHWTLKRDKGELNLNSLAILFVIMFLCAIATNLIGIFAIFGAFVLGATLSGETEFRAAITRQLRNFVTAFFLPIFFTYTGLHTDIGTLHSSTMWLFAVAVSAVAIIGKFGGCTVAARLSGMSNRESACVGIMMNTRALMELIVINVGYELGVIPLSVFCMLVMMALLTTVMTTPILLRLMRGTELEALIANSGFISPRRSRVIEPTSGAV